MIVFENRKCTVFNWNSILYRNQKIDFALFKVCSFAILTLFDVLFFHRMDRIRGTVMFFTGIVLVLFRWGLVGLIIEGIGFLNLFGNFLPTVLMIGRQIPILSTILNVPIVDQIADYIAGASRPKYSV